MWFFLTCIYVSSPEQSFTCLMKTFTAPSIVIGTPGDDEAPK